MRELQSGLWHWQAPHPGWSPDEPWEQEVSSYAIDDGSRLLLFDPLAPPGELEKLAAERETAIVLTNPWHERDTRSLIKRFDAPVFTPPPETQEDLMRKYEVTAEQAAGGSPDLAWLVAGGEGDARLYSPGEGLPTGIEAFPGRDEIDHVLWIEDQRVVIAGDSLVDFGRGLEIPLEWLRKDVTREQVAEALRPLLELPVELVLPTHGTPTDRAALERALAV
jgi:glyoxylase-like metal-dependent hydrolase (beta-lactamase superfamily II)